MAIMKSSLADKAFIKGINDKLLDSKVMNKMYKFASGAPDSFASRVALASALTKDAFGCYYYVTQSLNNKEIPDEKRNFVAALDLMNGILNVGIQLSVGLWIDSNSKKWFDKMNVGRALEKVNTEKVAKKITPLINLKEGAKNVTFEQVDNLLRTRYMGNSGKVAKWLKIGFRAAVMLTATQVVIKRMIVPFFSTPLASWYKEKYMDKKEKPKEDDKFGPTKNYIQWFASSKDAKHISTISSQIQQK